MKGSAWLPIALASFLLMGKAGAETIAPPTFAGVTELFEKENPGAKVVRISFPPADQSTAAYDITFQRPGAEPHETRWVFVLQSDGHWKHVAPLETT